MKFKTAGGKGDRRRPEDNEKYNDNYDRIFGGDSFSSNGAALHQPVEIDFDTICRAHIKKEEGYRTNTYFCTQGLLTGGYGHKILPNEPIPTSREGWEELFDKDYLTAKTGAMKLITSVVKPEALGIVTEMVYQMGYTGVSKFKKMLKAVNVGDYKTASVEMLDSLWAKQTPQRAKRMSKRMQNI